MTMQEFWLGRGGQLHVRCDSLGQGATGPGECGYGRLAGPVAPVPSKVRMRSMDWTIASVRISNQKLTRCRSVSRIDSFLFFGRRGKTHEASEIVDAIVLSGGE